MGWKGTLRSWEASINRMERERERAEREVIKEQKLQQKLNELLTAQEEVNNYQDYIEEIKSIHKDTFNNINWSQVLNKAAPIQPIKLSTNEKIAQDRYDNFRPSLFQKLFKRVDKAKVKLAIQIETARLLDERNFKEASIRFKHEYTLWEQNRLKAQRVLAFEQEILQSIINESELLEKIPLLGSNIIFEMKDNNELHVDIFLHSEEIIPKEIKTLLKSGRISIKDLPKSKYYDLHQDYVCSVVIRVAREVFGLLPVDKIVVTAIDELLDRSTGHLATSPILSVLFIRETLRKLNFETLDPSDSMKNFLHNMSFKKGVGFSVVEKIDFN
ncbi:hypothetical protein PT276_01965 [Orbaceae bacterium ESL0721]|nr:hypothetical protein [Orbaceae bacterium ESL0721]